LRVLVINCPTALASSIDAAKATVEAVEKQRRLGHKKPVVATWLARSAVEQVRPLFAKANIPDFETPTEAIEGIIQLARYAWAQTELMQAPPAMPVSHLNAEVVDATIATALSQGRSLMMEPEAKAVLSAYGIPTVPTRVAATPQEVGRAAADLLRGYASVVVKILSPNLTHKSDLGGVRLDLTSAEEVENIARRMLSDIKAARPDATLEGVTVQPMIRRKEAYELILGISTDKFLARMTQIDYAREMAFIALRPDETEEQEALGVARFFAD
jgi:acetyltransferase